MCTTLILRDSTQTSTATPPLPPPPEPSATMEMFMRPLSSWNTASVTGKLIWKFSLKSYLWPVATILDSTDIADYNSICASHLFAFRSIPIAHTPYRRYVAGDCQFPGSLDNCLQVSSNRERLCVVKTRAGRVEAVPQVAFPGVITSLHNSSSHRSALPSTWDNPHWVAFISGLREYYLLPVSLQLSQVW